MTMSPKTALSLLAGLGLLLPLAGCSANAGMPKLGKVSGKVTYKGKPLEYGHIVFTPAAGKGGETGQSATGEIGSDGSYEMTTFNTGDGAILGQHVITVEARNKAEMPKVKPDSTIDYVLPKSTVPSIYASAEKSPLRFTVKEGSQKYDIDLKD